MNTSDILHQVENNEITRLELSHCLYDFELVHQFAQLLKNNTSVVHLEISVRYQRREQFVKTIELLQFNNHIQTLILNCNYIDPCAMTAICELLKSNQNLSELHLNKSYFGNDDSSINKLADTLKSHSRLRVLSISGFEMTQQGIDRIVESLMSNNYLENLNMCLVTPNNYHENATTISKLMRSNGNLKHLKWHGNSDVATIINSLQFSKLVTLKLCRKREEPQLFVPDIDIGVAVADLLSSSKISTLQSLKLIRVNISLKGSLAIAKSLERNNHLRALYLRDAEMDTNTANAFAETLAANDYLQLLSIVRCGLKPEGTGMIINSLKLNACLHTLILSINDICSEDINNLVDILESNESLTCLKLRSTGLDKSSVQHIKRLLSRPNNSLKSLDISRNRFDLTDIINICKSLRSNECLTYLNIFHGVCLTEGNLVAKALGENCCLTSIYGNGMFSVVASGSTYLSGIIERNKQFAEKKRFVRTKALENDS